MATRSCASETVKESEVLARGSVGKFPAGRETARILAGRTTRDCEASSMDWAALSLLMGFAAIAVEIVDCSRDFRQFRLSHRSACAWRATSLC